MIAMSSKGELERLAAELETLKQVIASLETQVSTLSTMLVEVQNAIKSVEEVKKCGKGTEMYVPLGAGVLLKVSVVDVDKLLLAVGARYFIEASPDNVVKYLSDRRSELEKALAEARNALEKAYRRYEEIVAALRALSQKEEKR